MREVEEDGEGEEEPEHATRLVHVVTGREVTFGDVDDARRRGGDAPAAAQRPACGRRHVAFERGIAVVAHVVVASVVTDGARERLKAAADERADVAQVEEVRVVAAKECEELLGLITDARPRPLVGDAVAVLVDADVVPAARKRTHTPAGRAVGAVKRARNTKVGALLPSAPLSDDYGGRALLGNRLPVEHSRADLDAEEQDLYREARRGEAV